MRTAVVAETLSALSAFDVAHTRKPKFCSMEVDGYDFRAMQPGLCCVSNNKTESLIHYVYWLLLRGGIVQSVPCTAAVSDLLCVTVGVLIIPDLSTRALWQIATDTPSSELGRHLARNVREFCQRNVSFILRRVLWYAVKSYDMVRRLFFSSEGNRAAKFYRPLKSIVHGLVWTREPCVQWQAR
jgi:hypothetical protein